MKINAAIIIGMSLILVGFARAEQKVSASVRDQQFQVFWAKYRKAVLANDKATVLKSAQYPLSMPYAQSPIKNVDDFSERYRDVFIEGTKECFEEGKPEKEKGSVVLICPNSQLYRFQVVSGKYKLTGVDNINE